MDSENLADKAMHEHSKLIRESQSYRNYLMMEELMAEMQPLLSQGGLPKDISITDKNNIIGEGRGEYKEIKQLRGMVLFLQSKLNEHLDKSKPKAKREW